MADTTGWSAAISAAKVNLATVTSSTTEDQMGSAEVRLIVGKAKHGTTVVDDPLLADLELNDDITSV